MSMRPRFGTFIFSAPHSRHGSMRCFQVAEHEPGVHSLSRFPLSGRDHQRSGVALIQQCPRGHIDAGNVGRSSTADGIRACLIAHPVQDGDAGRCFGLLARQRAGKKLVAKDALVSRHRGFRLRPLTKPVCLCQPRRPCSAMVWMWRSRWVGAVSAASLTTAMAHGGITTLAPASWAAMV